MASDEYSTEIELYGVSPAIISYIMLIITLIVPFGYISNHIQPELIYSFLWQIEIWIYGFYPDFLSLGLMLSLLPLTALNWAYAYWIVRYYRAKSSRFTVIMIGFLTLILPFIGSIFYSTALIGGYYLQIVYPIPLQFIAGLIILRRIEGPEIISPWSGMRLDLSWWKWRQGKPRNDWDPFEKEKKMVFQEDDKKGN
ncbi:MAG: hypothetical protein EAX87_08230 [Candidatus Thorarchaeota archaeon]|nr:hypothetical protein [Candidatus Thorarchaeota archaeon]